MSPKKLFIALTLCTGVAVGPFLALAADKPLPAASDKKGVSFAKDIKPIFEKSCTKCHGAEKQKGKLRLDSLEAVKKGGDNGKLFEPGKSAASTLVKAVARVNEDEAMPPEGKGDPLTKEQVGLIRAWIDQGGK
jgi:cytochrome c5